MKSKRTWISVGCVMLAVLLSQLYSMSTENSENELTTVSEVKPSIIAPSPTPVAVSGTINAAPKATNPPPKATKEPQKPKPAATPSSSPTEEEAPLSQTANAPASPAPSFVLPASGEVTRPYSKTELVYFAPLREWRCHLGMDFAPSDTDMIVAVFGGSVQKVYVDHLYGNTVIVDHGNGLSSLYGSLREAAVKEGDTVESGTCIGYMGDSAPCEEGVHLHFELQKDGSPINPLDANA